MLTNPEEYEGGEFLINTRGDQDKEVPTLKVKMGDLLVFYSHLPHKVAPVTSGCRVTLVTWALGAKLK
jgi:predicted 2-oxoglutarate/Fe(II)-dependent dioxygenase YbiX